MADYKDYKKNDGKATNPTKKIEVNSSSTNNWTPATQWWYFKDDYEILDAVKQMTALLERDIQSRISRYRVESRLYGIPDYFASLARTYNSNWNTSNVLPDRLTFNCVQSNIDTLISKSARLKPRARFLTNGGGFKAVKAAKKLSYFTEGIFQENDIYSIARGVLRDALVYGDGFIHIYSDNNRVRLERVIPYEIFVDELECLGGASPTHMYRIKLVSRQALMEMFPDKAEQIAQSQQLFSVQLHTTSPATDQIEVLEAWKIGTGEERKNGKRLMAVPDCLLCAEEWTEKRFPFARISWTQPFSGYWAQSLAEQLKSTQLEINKLLAVQQRSYHLAGSFKILVQNGSQIPVESFNNNVGTIIKYTGNAPQYITPPILPPEFYKNLETLIQRSYQLSGVSALSAYSQKPAGLNSGVALREYNDIESERFREWSMDIEQFFVDIAKASVGMARLIAENNAGHYPVNINNPKSLTKIDLKEVKLKEDDYTISVFPASSLPNDPAGRLETIDDLVKRGLLDPVEQRELLNFPDVEASNLLSTAQDEYLKEVFEKMLEDEEYTAPDPLMNLQLAQKLALQYYALGCKLGEGEEKLQLIRQFVSDIQDLQNPPAAPPVPNLPQPELGSQIAPSEAAQLALPAATGELPGAEALVQQAAGLPPTM
jgi:hypothetical protein